jgi:membrane-associated protease RseP (regulator of RpoE activity)
MRRSTKWSIYLFMAFAAIARGQTAEPKDPGKSDARFFYSQGNMYRSHPAGNGVADFYFDYPAQSPDQQLGLFAFHEVGDRNTGMSLAAVDEAVREHLKLPKGQGLIATSVAPQGMAARAGICENDILLTLGDAPLGKAEDLEERLKAAGDKPVGLVLLHQGSKKTVQVQPHLRVTFGPVQPQPPAFWIGVSVSPVEPALRAHLRLPAEQGLIVTEVIADSPAAKSELKVNDILLTMAGEPLKNQAALIDLVQKNGEKAAAVEVLREGSRMRTEVTPRRRQPSQTFTARLHPSTFRWDVVRPGVVLHKNAALSDLSDRVDLTLDQSNNLRWVYQQPEADSLTKRLDNVSAEIKELRKAIDELSKALKDRK